MTTTTAPLHPHDSRLLNDLRGPDGRGHPALVLHGDLDIATAPRLRALLEPALRGTAPVVVVDASSVTFTDCSGLEPLLDAAATLAARGARLRLVDASPAVRRVVTVLGARGVLGLGVAAPGPGATCA